MSNKRKNFANKEKIFEEPVDFIAHCKLDLGSKENI